MTKIGRSIIAVLVLGILAAGVAGCKKKEGPMERAGKELDNSAEKTGRNVDKAVEKAGEKLEKAGENIKDSAR